MTIRPSPQPRSYTMSVFFTSASFNIAATASSVVGTKGTSGSRRGWAFWAAAAVAKSVAATRMEQGTVFRSRIKLPLFSEVIAIRGEKGTDAFSAAENASVPFSFFLSQFELGCIRGGGWQALFGGQTPRQVGKVQDLAVPKELVFRRVHNDPIQRDQRLPAGQTRDFTDAGHARAHVLETPFRIGLLVGDQLYGAGGAGQIFHALRQ